MTANQTVLNDFINKHPFAAAQALELLPSQEVADFLQTLSFEKSTKILGLMNTQKAANCFIVLPFTKSKELMEKSDISLIVSLLKLVDEPMRTTLLTNISSGRQSIIQRYLSFSPNTVAALLETAVIVNKEMTIDNALELIKRSKTKEEYYLYVIDLDGVFEGIVRLKELLLADQSDVLEDLMISDVPNFLPNIFIQNLLEHSAWLEYFEIPILDTSGKLLGKLPYKSILKFTNSPNKISSNEIAETGSALSELYRIGLTGLFQGSGK